MKVSCIFCGTKTIQKSKEHILAQWLLKYLEITKEPFISQHNKALGNIDPFSLSYTPPDYLSRINRDHPYSSLVHGRVCKSCNSGWMSRSEDSTKPILIALINGEISFRKLSWEQRELLGRWASKTAYTLNDSFGDIKIKVPKEHLNFLKDQQSGLPNGVAVIMAVSGSSTNFTHNFSNNWKVSYEDGMSPDLVSEVLKLSYKLSFQIRNLHFMIAFNGHKNGYISPVYPEHGVVYASKSNIHWSWRPHFPVTLNHYIPKASIPHLAFHKSIEIAIFSASSLASVSCSGEITT